jgi:hypothetical protein
MADKRWVVCDDCDGTGSDEESGGFLSFLTFGLFGAPDGKCPTCKGEKGRWVKALDSTPPPPSGSGEF